MLVVREAQDQRGVSRARQHICVFKTREGPLDLMAVARMDSFTAPENFSELKSALHRELSGDTADVERVKRLMESYRAVPEDFADCIKWDPHRFVLFLLLGHCLRVRCERNHVARLADIREPSSIVAMANLI